MALPHADETCPTGVSYRPLPGSRYDSERPYSFKVGHVEKSRWIRSAAEGPGGFHAEALESVVAGERQRSMFRTGFRWSPVANSILLKPSQSPFTCHEDANVVRGAADPQDDPRHICEAAV